MTESTTPPDQPDAALVPREGNSPREIAGRARDAATSGIARVEGAVGQNIMSMVALVLVCLGVITYICAPIGAILGHVARRQTRTRNQPGGGMALASIIVGWGITLVYSCGLVVGLVYLVVQGVAIVDFFTG
jgi:uncharacterized membrane protein YedE/YeeE